MSNVDSQKLKSRHRKQKKANLSVAERQAKRKKKHLNRRIKYKKKKGQHNQIIHKTPSYAPYLRATPGVQPAEYSGPDFPWIQHFGATWQVTTPGSSGGLDTTYHIAYDILHWDGTLVGSYTGEVTMPYSPRPWVTTWINWPVDNGEFFLGWSLERPSDMKWAMFNGTQTEGADNLPVGDWTTLGYEAILAADRAVHGLSITGLKEQAKQKKKKIKHKFKYKKGPVHKRIKHATFGPRLVDDVNAVPESPPAGTTYFDGSAWRYGIDLGGGETDQHSRTFAARKIVHFDGTDVEGSSFVGEIDYDFVNPIVTVTYTNWPSGVSEEVAFRFWDWLPALPEGMPWGVFNGSTSYDYQTASGNLPGAPVNGEWTSEYASIKAADKTAHGFNLFGLKEQVKQKKNKIKHKIKTKHPRSKQKKIKHLAFAPFQQLTPDARPAPSEGIQIFGDAEWAVLTEDPNAIEIWTARDICHYDGTVASSFVGHIDPQVTVYNSGQPDEYRVYQIDFTNWPTDPARTIANLAPLPVAGNGLDNWPDIIQISASTGGGRWARFTGTCTYGDHQGLETVGAWTNLGFEAIRIADKHAAGFSLSKVERQSRRKQKRIKRKIKSKKDKQQKGKKVIHKTTPNNWYVTFSVVYEVEGNPADELYFRNGYISHSTATVSIVSQKTGEINGTGTATGTLTYEEDYAWGDVGHTYISNFYHLSTEYAGDFVIGSNPSWCIVPGMERDYTYPGPEVDTPVVYHVLPLYASMQETADALNAAEVHTPPISKQQLRRNAKSKKKHLKHKIKTKKKRPLGSGKKVIHKPPFTGYPTMRATPGSRPAASGNGTEHEISWGDTDADWNERWWDSGGTGSWHPNISHIALDILHCDGVTVAQSIEGTASIVVVDEQAGTGDVIYTGWPVGPMYSWPYYTACWGIYQSEGAMAGRPDVLWATFTGVIRRTLSGPYVFISGSWASLGFEELLAADREAAGYAPASIKLEARQTRKRIKHKLKEKKKTTHKSKKVKHTAPEPVEMWCAANGWDNSTLFATPLECITYNYELIAGQGAATYGYYVLPNGQGCSCYPAGDLTAYCGFAHYIDPQTGLEGTAGNIGIVRVMVSPNDSRIHQSNIGKHKHPEVQPMDKQKRKHLKHKIKTKYQKGMTGKRVVHKQSPRITAKGWSNVIETYNGEATAWDFFWETDVTYSDGSVEHYDNENGHVYSIGSGGVNILTTIDVLGVNNGPERIGYTFVIEDNYEVIPYNTGSAGSAAGYYVANSQPVTIPAYCLYRITIAWGPGDLTWTALIVIVSTHLRDMRAAAGLSTSSIGHRRLEEQTKRKQKHLKHKLKSKKKLSKHKKIRHKVGVITLQEMPWGTEFGGGTYPYRYVSAPAFTTIGDLLVGTSAIAAYFVGIGFTNVAFVRFENQGEFGYPDSPRSVRGQFSSDQGGLAIPYYPYREDDLLLELDVSSFVDGVLTANTPVVRRTGSVPLRYQDNFDSPPGGLNLLDVGRQAKQKWKYLPNNLHVGTPATMVNPIDMGKIIRIVHRTLRGSRKKVIHKPAVGPNFLMVPGYFDAGGGQVLRGFLQGQMGSIGPGTFLGASIFSLCSTQYTDPAHWDTVFILNGEHPQDFFNYIIGEQATAYSAEATMYVASGGQTIWQWDPLMMFLNTDITDEQVSIY